MSTPQQNLGVPIYEPINGKEARQILKHDHNEKVDKIPLFKEGHAFHRIHMIYAMTCTCYPADCPVPQMEFEIARSAKGFDENADYIQQKDKVEALEAKEKELEIGLERVRNILSVIRPVIEIDGDLADHGTPDNLRLAHGLPVPRMITTTDIDGNTTKGERYIHIDPQTASQQP